MTCLRTYDPCIVWLFFPRTKSRSFACKCILVGGIPTPLKNMSSSVGIMTFPIYGKIKNVPNHQPGKSWEIVTTVPTDPEHDTANFTNQRE